MHVEAFDTRIWRWRKVSLSKASGRHLNLLFNLRKTNIDQEIWVSCHELLIMLIACLDVVFLESEWPIMARNQ